MICSSSCACIHSAGAEWSLQFLGMLIEGDVLLTGRHLTSILCLVAISGDFNKLRKINFSYPDQ